MNCAELQRILPDIMEGDRTAEQAAHLQSCSTCSGLVSDLDMISQQARLLRASEEPSPRVWISIENALRAEGLIRRPQRDLELGAIWARRRSPVWLVPVAAALLVTVGVLRYERGPARPEFVEHPAAPAPNTTAELRPLTNATASDDEQLLTVVGSRSPTMRTAYQADLQDVDAYIRDAEFSARTNPNDEEAQRYLMNAYEQKAMVYEMGLDRSLP
jgi:hypothetical protein